MGERVNVGRLPTGEPTEVMESLGKFLETLLKSSQSPKLSLLPNDKGSCCRPILISYISEIFSNFHRELQLVVRDKTSY